MKLWMFFHHIISKSVLNPLWYCLNIIFYNLNLGRAISLNLIMKMYFGLRQNYFTLCIFLLAMRGLLRPTIYTTDIFGLLILFSIVFLIIRKIKINIHFKLLMPVEKIINILWCLKILWEMSIFMRIPSLLMRLNWVYYLSMMNYCREVSFGA